MAPARHSSIGRRWQGGCLPSLGGISCSCLRNSRGWARRFRGCPLFGGGTTRGAASGREAWHITLTRHHKQPARDGHRDLANEVQEIPPCARTWLALGPEHERG